MRSTKLDIVSLYPTSMSELIVLLNTIKTLDKNILNLYFLDQLEFRPFCGKISVIKMLVSIFGQTTVYRVYTVSREPIRFLEIQYCAWHLIKSIIFTKV